MKYILVAIELPEDTEHEKYQDSYKLRKYVEGLSLKGKGSKVLSKNTVLFDRNSDFELSHDLIEKVKRSRLSYEVLFLSSDE